MARYAHMLALLLVMCAVLGGVGRLESSSRQGVLDAPGHVIRPQQSAVQLAASSAAPGYDPAAQCLPAVRGPLAELVTQRPGGPLPVRWSAHQNGESVVLRLPSALLFPDQGVRPRGAGQEELARLAALVRPTSLQLAIRVSLEPTGSAADKTWERAALRAAAITAYLNRQGLAESRLSATVQAGDLSRDRAPASRHGDCRLEIVVRPGSEGES
jgi:hypothetical protein